MVDKLKILLAVHKQSLPFSNEKRKTTVILIGVLLLFLMGGFFVYLKFTGDNTPSELALVFDAEGPYALLVPRRDGNALILNIKRTSSYDRIKYDLAYTSEAEEIAVEGSKITEADQEKSGGSIDRGVSGTINTSDRKGEYEQEILFGTCSKAVCKYDQGVENGTLTLYIQKGSITYKMLTQWHLQQPDIALGRLTSGDGHFIYQIDTDRQTLSNIGFTLISDLTGVPKLPNKRKVLGKVYALNVPLAKNLPEGDMSINLAENPPTQAKIYRYNGSEWKELDTKIEGSKVSAKSDGAGIFAVLIQK